MAIKRIGFFFLLAMAVYAILIIPWPGVMSGYRSAFRTLGVTFFGKMGSSGTVSFEKLPAENHQADMRIILGNRRAPKAKLPFDFKSILIGYRPTAFLVALVMASPIPWSRRWRALLWGLLWVNVFVAFRMWLLLTNAFSNDNPMAVYSYSPFVKGILEPSLKVMFFSPAVHYIVPAFIWLLVTFRQGDMKTLLGMGERENPGLES